MTFTGKIICGVYEGKMMAQSLSTPDDAAVCEEEEEEEPAISYEMERVDILNIFYKCLKYI